MSKHFAGSGSQFSFAKAPHVAIPRSRFNRPSTYKSTFGAGQLIPFYVDEVIPGDTHRLDVSAFARMTTQVVPVMDGLYMDFQFFFVPYRLVWDHWEQMHGDRPTPTSSVDYTTPFIPAPNGGASVGSLADYFGLPINVKWRDGAVSALPFRAYNLIWNEWFRDEFLQNPAPFTTADSGDTLADYVVLPRGKRKDYFTSCLPTPQRGPTVLLPLGATAPVEVYGNGNALGLWSDNSAGDVFPARFATSSGSYDRVQLGAPSTMAGDNVVSLPANVNTAATQPGGTALGVTPNASKSGLTGLADLSNAISPSINQLREAFQIQRLYERDNNGSRYVELLRNHYGVTSPDARLQRPELLGTFTLNVSIDQVAQTSATEVGTTPLGNLSALASFTGVKNSVFAKSFVEWGVIIGLVSVRSDLTYQQGIPRFWSRRSRFDYYYPVLAHLGEQAVLGQEIYCDGTEADESAFGYQERWSEYKFGYNKITGELRSTAPASLDVWHLAQVFENRPTLSPDFIVENPPLNRLLAVSDTPAFLFDSFCMCESVRPLPLHDTPGLVDHF